MAWNSRLTAKDLGQITVNTVALLAYFRDLTSTKSVAEIDVGAVNDTYRVVKGGRVTGTLEIEVAAEGADLLNTASTLGTWVAYSHNLNGTATTGSALITSSSRRAGGVDGAQTQTFSLSIIA